VVVKTVLAACCLLLDPGAFGSVWAEPEPDRVVVFVASWCGPCASLKADLAELPAGWSVGPRSSAHIQVVDIDKRPELWRKWSAAGVNSIPQAVKIENGRPVRWETAPTAVGLTWFFYGSDPDFRRVFR